MMTNKTEDLAEQKSQLRLMRAASVLEATTLALLVIVAVPLKHAFGIPQMVSIMGPVHGVAFLIYLWMLVQSHYTLSWTRAEWLRMICTAFIPLAGFINERLLKRRQDSLVASA